VEPDHEPDHGHKVELADEHLQHSQRPPDRLSGREVAEARRGEDGEAEVHPLALGAVGPVREVRGGVDLDDEADDPGEQEADQEVDGERAGDRLQRHAMHGDQAKEPAHEAQRDRQREHAAQHRRRCRPEHSHADADHGERAENRDDCRSDSAHLAVAA